MKKTIIFIVLMGLGISNTSCGQAGKTAPVAESVVKEFKYPAVPVTLTSPEDRADYLAEHYWTHFNFTDTTYIHMPEITEQAYVNYIDVLKLIDRDKATGYMAQTMRGAESNKLIFHYFGDLAEKYLYDPNSPFQNDQLYIPVLETLIKSDYSSESDKIRYNALLTMAKKNLPGSIALNFSFILKNNTKKELNDIQSSYILLFLNDIDCENCLQTTTDLSNSDVINSYIKNKSLTVLSVYTGVDEEGWKHKVEKMPANWINGFDSNQEIANEELYDLKAMPTLYLLDKGKKVLLKDADLDEILLFLQNTKN